MTSDATLLHARTTTARTIRDELERTRLEHRARRIRVAMTALHGIADARAVDGPVPPPLEQALAGFAHELDVVGRRLAEL